MACLPFSQVYAREKEAGDLYLAVADWAYEVRDQGDYDPNPTGRFPKGQMAYAYLELAGFTTAAHGDLYSYHVAVDVGLKTTWGFPCLNRPTLLSSMRLPNLPKRCGSTFGSTYLAGRQGDICHCNHSPG